MLRLQEITYLKDNYFAYGLNVVSKKQNRNISVSDGNVFVFKSKGSRLRINKEALIYILKRKRPLPAITEIMSSGLDTLGNLRKIDKVKLEELISKSGDYDEKETEYYIFCLKTHINNEIERKIKNRNQDKAIKKIIPDDLSHAILTPSPLNKFRGFN